MPPSASSIPVPDSLAEQTATLRSEPELHEGETILATMEPDLDAEMRFATSRVLLTNQRMISDSADGRWISWPLQPGMNLEHSDHAGVGTLALHDEFIGSMDFEYLRNALGLGLIIKAGASEPAI